MFYDIPATDLNAETAPGCPQRVQRVRRVVSFESTRPGDNSRPLSWVFVGARMMPRSEHLIPFLN